MRNPTDRFMEKVIPEPNSGCWLWDSTIHHKSGYGMFSLNYKAEQAHRVSYSFFVEEFDSEEKILHKCDNRMCVNPDHLFKGTQKINVEDMYRKGRAPRKDREFNGRAILTEEDVNFIRSSNDSHASLGRLFGVNGQTIYSIRNGLSWKNK